MPVTSCPPAAEIGGVWAEVAVDGVVVLERDLRVSRALTAIRRDIASCRFVGRVVHGHPYWTAA